ncbi:hypothetical protein A3F06_01560 [candidate division TM6 bacterium RIFCSPHIGHO2_12_FULL_36_22]|nr:MAG: hypothetical protein A3F06_01560 [candidate division TM6 bacterium RIFCSPHIGHO2_12_FULL_36_22]
MRKLLLLGMLVSSCVYAQHRQDIPEIAWALQHIDRELNKVAGYINNIDIQEWIPMMLDLPLQTTQEKIAAQSKILTGLSKDAEVFERASKRSIEQDYLNTMFRTLAPKVSIKTEGEWEDIQVGPTYMELQDIDKIVCDKLKPLESKLQPLLVQSQKNLKDGIVVLNLQYEQATWAERAAQLLRGNLPQQLKDLLNNYVAILNRLNIAIKKIKGLLACA